MQSHHQNCSSPCNKWNIWIECKIVKNLFWNKPKENTNKSLFSPNRKDQVNRWCILPGPWILSNGFLFALQISIALKQFFFRFDVVVVAVTFAQWWWWWAFHLGLNYKIARLAGKACVSHLWILQKQRDLAGKNKSMFGNHWNGVHSVRLHPLTPSRGPRRSSPFHGCSSSIWFGLAIQSGPWRVNARPVKLMHITLVRSGRCWSGLIARARYTRTTGTSGTSGRRRQIIIIIMIVLPPLNNIH